MTAFASSRSSHLKDSEIGPNKILKYIETWLWQTETESDPQLLLRRADKKSPFVSTFASAPVKLPPDLRLVSKDGNVLSKLQSAHDNKLITAQ
jgi:hypothetical protein